MTAIEPSPRDSFQDRLRSSPLIREGILAHLVSTASGRYVYDTYSNEFFAADQISYDLLHAAQGADTDARVAAVVRLCSTYSEADLDAALGKLEVTRRDDDILKPLPPDLAFEVAEGKLLESDRGRFQTLTLEVTEACNFRCTYCVYSGDYEHEREHTTTHMTQETAFSAIDRFLEHADWERSPTINFYGGEALLRKDLILECMAYARQKKPAVQLSITTNGFLIDAELTPSLVDYDVQLFISIDGPKKIHDRFRVLASNKPTFERIIANLEALAEAHPDYFARKVHFTLVMSSSENFEAIAEFFNSRDIFKNGNIQVGTVSNVGLSEEGEKNWDRPYKREDTEAARQRYIDALVSGDLSGVRFEHKAFGRALESVVRRNKTRVTSKWRKKGPCTVGELRLFATSDGKFRNCEKTGRLPDIGSVEDGFDHDRIRGMQADLLSTTEGCKSCWALRLCDVCYVHIYDSPDGGSIDLETKARQCNLVRRTRHSALTMLAEVIERNSASAAEPDTQVQPRGTED